MTDAASNFDHVDFDEMFAALCSEVGFCLHDKGQKKVIAALPKGLDAAMKAVLAAEGVDEPNAPGDLKKAVRDCLKAHVQPG
ncbi:MULTISPECIES: hypothetical protein [unclassified Brevundimonas]|uniref:hypothetical protein n=1 Tax=unclassified Brevundimonas TaxID=2622653 RepID=UPI000CFAD80F|nr:MULTISPECIES: hypothetical protein [unclassified Brevundimonas]PRA27736.1 hypothetical protein CQ024_10855 [Brevundimonas sp. MYb27]PQZ81103.1 hypothetical protein CQ026_10270 [Brevundimonas sp. MYb31]PRB15330.1 hypothetical protein CQ039_07875 [Brevundimonas sp. MYb52]PRB35747.1 hypothetical protein CQ035_07730 [Brevundimonas sp. MYb46]PRB44688.1 hypothetical protein CQ028_13525 [Brevundimonas sp. MYb33]